jgi:hypothetical protein
LSGSLCVADSPASLNSNLTPRSAQSRDATPESRMSSSMLTASRANAFTRQNSMLGPATGDTLEHMDASYDASGGRKREAPDGNLGRKQSMPVRRESTGRLTAEPGPAERDRLWGLFVAKATEKLRRAGVGLDAGPPEKRLSDHLVERVMGKRAVARTAAWADAAHAALEAADEEDIVDPSSAAVDEALRRLPSASTFAADDAMMFEALYGGVVVAAVEGGGAPASNAPVAPLTSMYLELLAESFAVTDGNGRPT